MKLGIIGCGRMGSALLRGVLDAGVFRREDIAVVDAISAAAEAARSTFDVAIAESTAALLAESDAVILCVKPGDAIAALKQEQAGLAGKLVISIVAGLTLTALEDAAGGSARVIRVMPNTPAQIGKGASAYALGTRATREDEELTARIFGAVGVAISVKEELLDAVTGLSGSGPAFVYTMIEALSDGGVLVGLPRDVALKLAAQTVAGAAEMVTQTGQHPATLKDAVTSPGGTTIAGLNALEQGGFRHAVIAAVRTATERSRELGSR